MKTVWKVMSATVVIGGSIWAGSLLNLTAEGSSVAGQPGTADDPVVTKSYVDQAIQQALKGGVTTTKPSAPSTSSGGSKGGGSTDVVEVVTVEPGQTLIAGAGAEFVVRAGKAVIYSSDADGVTDLTDGVDIKNGGAVTNNHLLSFPRDGRGVQVQAGNKYSLTVLVRGGYSLK